MIRDARESRGLTQGEVADSLNRSTDDNYLHTTIGRIEKGTRKISLVEAVHLADLLGIEWDALFESLKPTSVSRKTFQITEHLSMLSDGIKDISIPELKVIAKYVREARNEIVHSIGLDSRTSDLFQLCETTSEELENTEEKLVSIYDHLDEMSADFANAAVELRDIDYARRIN